MDFRENLKTVTGRGRIEIALYKKSRTAGNGGNWQELHPHGRLIQHLRIWMLDSLHGAISWSAE